MNARNRLLTTRETAAIIGMSEAWLEQDRHKADSARIPFVKLGKAARYRLSDVEAFIDGLEARTMTPRSKRARKTDVAA